MHIRIRAAAVFVALLSGSIAGSATPSQARTDEPGAVRAMAAGYWQLGETRYWHAPTNDSGWPRVRDSTIDHSYSANDGWYFGNTVGTMAGGSLVSAASTYNAQRRDASTVSRTIGYSWDLVPPATAAAGQELPIRLTAGIQADSWADYYPPYGELGARFDHADVGNDSIYIRYSGSSATTGDVSIDPANAVGTFRGNIKFPTGDTSQYKLQLKTWTWAMDYIYTWVPGAEPAAPAAPPAATPADGSPGTPLGLTMTALKKHRASIVWSAPDTGSAVTGYTIYARSKAPRKKKWSSWQSFSVSETRLLLKVKKAGTWIQVYAVASNDAGDSAATEPIATKMR